jgi:sulfatase maturation enzyme AslB (radical SAM superfamily)
MTDWYKTQDIGRVQLEITNYCNAACPYCERGIYPNEELNNTNISIKTLKKFFNGNEWPNLNQIHLCGNVDEPTIHPNFFDVIDYLLTVNNTCWITISTNGGARNEEFWKKLASYDRVRVLFGIDGLNDTNHLYRINVNWDALMRNVKSYISNGGTASWQFIVFDHNQHQIEEAKTLASTMKFIDFKIISSNRNRDPVLKKPATQIIPKPIKFYDGHSAPSLKVINKALSIKKEQVKTVSGITCAAKPHSGLNFFSNDGTLGNIYMTYKGNVYPCCWVASKRGLSEISETAFGIDMKSNSIHFNDLDDIINGELWNHINDQMESLRCKHMCGNTKKGVDFARYIQF